MKIKHLTVHVNVVDFWKYEETLEGSYFIDLSLDPVQSRSTELTPLCLKSYTA